jgi:uncharacterized protein
VSSRRLRRLLLAVLVPLVLVLGLSGSATAVSSTVVISQIYGGGGNSGATHTHDFVELFNRGSQTVDLEGWSIQYTSATGTGLFGAPATQLTELSGSIAPGKYLLVQEATQAAVGSPLPTPDVTDATPIAMGATAGKVALISSTTPLGCNGGSTACSPAALAQIVDLIGYGNANFFEGAAAPTLSNSTAALRAASGCTDTDNNAADFAAGAPAPRNSATAANSCGVVEDAAPTVASSSPGGGASNVAADANVSITFSEAVTATAPWSTISCTVSGAHSATVTGGPTSFTLNPDVSFTFGESCTVTVLAAQVTDQDTTDPPDAMAADHSFTFSVGNPCADVFTPIPAIQGSGNASPVVNTSVTTQGVVVGDFEGPATAGLQGFYLQDAAGDGNTATSDGIFVFTGNANNNVSVGQLVRVTGVARERFGQTALNGSNSDGAAVPPANIVACGTGSVAHTNVTMPFAATDTPERYEGMLVRLPQTLVISEYFNYERFGEIVLGNPLAGESRHFAPTSVVEPGPAAQARLAQYTLNRITLDDGLAAQNPISVRHPNGMPFGLTNLFRGGDTVTNTVGVIGFDFNLYRIQPTAPATYEAVNPRPDEIEAPEGLRVATMNTLNFFLTADTTVNDNGPGPCGGNANLDCRGADSDQPLEFERQRTKLLAALAGLESDVIGLNELENTPGVDPLGDPDPDRGIVAGLNAMPGVGPYAAIDTGVIGTDAIKVGLIYKPGAVTPVGGFEILDSTDDPRFIDTRSRPVLAQTFEVNATGARFTVAVNHLKSKSSACADIGDPDTGDGQGNCNLTRLAAARALVDWLATDPTDSDDPDFLIMGDLNSYAKEDPIDAVLAGSDDLLGSADDYTNLVERYEGPHAYSFVFDGQAGYLDHGLANTTLAEQVLGATEWHINADEPDFLDYDTTFKPTEQEAVFEFNEFRSADHDPLVVTLCADLTACAEDRLRQLIEVLEVVYDQASKKAQDKIEDVIAKAEDALEKLEDGDRKGAVGALEGAAGDLEQAVRKNQVAFGIGNVLLQEMGAVARLLAVDAIEEAKATGGKASKIGQAERQLLRGDERIAQSRFKEGIARYGTAISEAEGA